MEGLTLNGGTVSAPGVSDGDWGAFTIGSTVTAGGATTSTISAELAVTGVQTFSVGTDSTLSISGVMHNRISAAAGGITKTGSGTLTLSEANSYIRRDRHQRPARCRSVTEAPPVRSEPAMSPSLAP